MNPPGAVASLPPYLKSTSNARGAISANNRLQLGANMQVMAALKWATPTRHPHREQRKPRLFDRLGKEEALSAVGSMLDDPTLCYQTIAQHFGVTRQRIAKFAAEMGVDGRQRQRQRKLLTPVLLREPDY